MADQFGFQPLCNKPAESQCNYYISHDLHLGAHVTSSNNERPVEKILENLNIEVALGDSFEEVHKISNPIMDATLDKIYEQISIINILKTELSNRNLENSYCGKLLKKWLNSIQEYNEVFDIIKTGIENAMSIDELPLSLMEIMLLIENAENEIEFLWKLNEISLLENDFRNEWLKKFRKNTEIENLKSNFKGKIKDFKKWCLNRKNNKNTFKSSENEKIVSLLNKLSLISELTKTNFEAKYFFQIKNNNLLIYSPETQRECIIYFTLYRNNFVKEAQVVALPNNEIFCLWNYNLACKINLKTLKVIRMFPRYRGSRYYPLIYYDNCVYAFGTTKIFEKYDLIKNLKTTLPKHCIQESSDFSCCVYKNSILFCAELSLRLFKFDFLIQSYSEILFNGMDSLSRKRIFTGNMRAYIYDDRKGIFESGIDNEYVWNRISENINIFYIEEIDQSIANSVYFYLIDNEDSMDIYKFDLCNKQLYRESTKNYIQDFHYRRLAIY
ncbi:unnamed protein product [Blepharisma stoltei]|uniref:Uncharacterized protein n=1 Tax=Blepharisma stoltei TaxID=1481888 RepID=A0AAU9ISH8_9CILI|nr:unnamed protein product [Blepharisma stoltei]